MFFRLSEGSALARERRGRETRETRAAASPVSRLQSLVWSFSGLARSARRTKKKERVLRSLYSASLH